MGTDAAIVRNMEQRTALMSQHASIIDLVKGLSRGPCLCMHLMASCGWSCDPVTGKTSAHYDPGSKIECLRCKARTCLEVDGIEYEKVDHTQVIFGT